MRDALREKATHLTLALLLCAGMLMPVLGVLLPGVSPARPLLIAAALCAALEAASLHRVSSVAAGIGLPLGAAAWLLAPGHLTRVTDVLTALTLRLQGQKAALPLAAADTVLLVSLACSLLCWLVTLRSVSYMPSLLLCIGTAMLLWFTGARHLVPWLLPALTATLAFLILDRHPQTSPVRLFALAALLTAAAWLLTPADGVTVEPMRDKADELRQMILDRLFYTEPRDVFSLSSEGYYPQGSGQLGGTPDPSDRPVMQVSSPRTVYLRGVILNDYDGHAWRNTMGGRRNLWLSPRTQGLRDQVFDQSLPAVAQTGSMAAPADVSVRMLSGGASTLFVPQRVRELTPGGGLVPYFSNSSELFGTRNLIPGDTWAVSAPLFQAGDPGLSTLVEAASSMPDSAWEDVLETYTRLPDHLEQPVYELAAEITSAASTPYDRAFALQSWLSRNCRYTLEVSPHPANRDFVTRFLMETREGYCTYFASALTVLCRMAGLPARYVEGYLAEPNAQGEALVTGLNAHAWTEVYFRGFGWLTFDATPRQRSGGDAPENGDGESEPESGPTPEPEEPAVTPEPASDPVPPENPESPENPETPADPDNSDNPDDPGGAENPEAPEDSGRPAWLSLLPWLLLLMALAGLIFRALRSRPESQARRAKDEAGRVQVWAQALMDALAADRLTRKKGETLLRFAHRVEEMHRYTVSPVPAAECLSLLRYSRALPLQEDTTLLRDTALGIQKELRPAAKARLLARRIFVPARRRSWTKA